VVRLRSEGTGSVPLKVRWSRWLTVAGPACIERHGDGEGARLRLTGPGEVVVSSVLRLDPPGQC